MRGTWSPGRRLRRSSVGLCGLYDLARRDERAREGSRLRRRRSQLHGLVGIDGDRLEAVDGDADRPFTLDGFPLDRWAHVECGGASPDDAAVNVIRADMLDAPNSGSRWSRWRWCS